MGMSATVAKAVAGVSFGLAARVTQKWLCASKQSPPHTTQPHVPQLQECTMMTMTMTAAGLVHVVRLRVNFLLACQFES